MNKVNEIKFRNSERKIENESEREKEKSKA